MWGLLSLLLSHSAPDAKAQSDTKPDRLDQLKPRGDVNDFAGIIDPAAQSQLDIICKDPDRQKRTQMAIVTLVSPLDLALRVPRSFKFSSESGQNSIQDTRRACCRDAEQSCAQSI